MTTNYYTVYSGIDGDFEEFKTIEEAHKSMMEIIQDGKEIHPDAESVFLYKNIGAVIIDDKDGEQNCKIILPTDNSDQETKKAQNTEDAFVELQSKCKEIEETLSEYRSEVWSGEHKSINDINNELSEERATSAKLVEALKGLRDYFKFMVKDPQFNEFVKAQEALAEYEGKGGGNG